jgi:hypothetical protein
VAAEEEMKKPCPANAGSRSSELLDSRILRIAAAVGRQNSSYEVSYCDNSDSPTTGLSAAVPKSVDDRSNAT